MSCYTDADPVQTPDILSYRCSFKSTSSHLDTNPSHQTPPLPLHHTSRQGIHFLSLPAFSRERRAYKAARKLEPNKNIKKHTTSREDNKESQFARRLKV